jgi:polyhydroxyalkanoate synthesis regulator phasin
MATSLEKLFEDSIRKAFDSIVEEEIKKAVESVKKRLSEQAETIAHQIKGIYSVQHDKDGIRIAVSQQFASDNRSIEELREKVNELENKLRMYKRII